jgi:Zn-dependent M32 family carboxypeptidase
MAITISSPEDRKKIKEAVQEISNSLTRIEAERDMIREIVKEVSDTHQIPRKIIAKISKTFHKQNLAQEVSDHEDFVDLYDTVTKNI